MLRRSCISVLGIELNNADFDISLLRIIDVVEHDLAIEPSREVRLVAAGATFSVVTTACSRRWPRRPGDARAAVEVFLAQVVHNNAGQESLLLPTSAEEFIASFDAS